MKLASSHPRVKVCAPPPTTLSVWPASAGLDQVRINRATGALTGVERVKNCEASLQKGKFSTLEYHLLASIIQKRIPKGSGAIKVR